MAKISDFFWENAEQTRERLSESIVLYDNVPAFVTSVQDHEDGVPRLELIMCDKPKDFVRKIANSPKFKRYRELPSIGWMNVMGDHRTSTKLESTAALVERRNMVARTHGLCDGNTSVTIPVIDNNSVHFTALGNGLRGIMFDSGFSAMHAGEYPSLQQILINIVPVSSIAYSRVFCVLRDDAGLRWLYRYRERVGIFTGSDSLNLLTKYVYLREEIMADPAFTLNTIREF